jgi:hypothetical protein
MIPNQLIFQGIAYLMIRWYMDLERHGAKPAG